MKRVIGALFLKNSFWDWDGLLIYLLSIGAVTDIEYTASNNWMIVIRKYVEENGRGLTAVLLQHFTWRD
jgi:hypothetical protein